MSIILSIKNLSKSYKVFGNNTYALDDISFDIKQGQFVAITGASGSGKSTLLHLMGGVDIPTAGTVYVDGVDIYTMSPKQLSTFRRRKVSIIYQFYNLLPMLNVRSNITLPVELDGKKVDEKEILHILKLLGLSEKEFYYPNQLSGGQQQRVAIARALITSPAIILADEPTGNLDSKNSKDILDLLKKANFEFGQTIIIVTHDAEIANQADRIIKLCDGKIISDITL